jgi:hypothetical protein
MTVMTKAQRFDVLDACSDMMDKALQARMRLEDDPGTASKDLLLMIDASLAVGSGICMFLVDDTEAMEDEQETDEVPAS